MKRRDLLRHLEKHGCEFLREGGIAPSTLTVARRNHPQFRDIARSSISSRERSVKTWTFPSRDFSTAREWSRWAAKNAETLKR
jgi:hypothetical protein